MRLPSDSSNTLRGAPVTHFQNQSGSKEVTIWIDHYRPPCVDRFRSQWCYYLATEEKPHEFPYFYGDIEGFKFQWGRQYQLRVIQEEAPQSAASRYTYRLVKILSDKKVRPQQTFRIPLKLPLNPPFFTSDESSNVYLLGEVRIKIIDAKMRSRLLRLKESAAAMDSISGDFKHDQKNDNVITLIRLQHEVR
jgi:hypothetical protein